MSAVIGYLKSALLCVVCFGAALSLPSCGGATAQSTPVPGPGPVQATPAPASAPPTGGAADGYSNAFKTIRDTFFATGGAPGFVNVANLTKTIAGKAETSFEWATLSVLDNYSDAGENVAVYAQANKFGNGPVWGGVSEVNDTTGSALGAMVAHEFDVFTSGKDNGYRIGLSVVNGDGKANRGYVRSEFAEATTALAIGQSVSFPWASWGTGINMTGNFRDSIMRVTAPDGRVVFEIKPNGDIWRRGVLLP